MRPRPHDPEVFMNRMVLMVLALAFPLGAKADRPGDRTTIAARSQFFGAENVDQRSGEVNPKRVIVSWITNASFAVAAQGRILLLDTFVTRLENPAGRTPFTIDDLVNLHPDAIFIGHGHFDHADNAAFIAAQTGATIYASPETCDNMAIDATNNFNRQYTSVPTVTCKPVTSRGSLPGAEI